MQRSTQHAFEPDEVMAYLDGELEPQRATALAAHLQHCAACQEVAHGFRALSEKMLEFEVEPPSARMNETVLDALDSAKLSLKAGVQRAADRKPWNWRNLFAHRPAWAFASFVIVAMLFVIIPVLYRTRELARPGFQRATDLSAPVVDMQQLRSEPLYAPRPGLTMSASQQADSSSSSDETPASDALKAPESVGPMIVQTASLNILATNYDEASAAIEKLAAAHGGYVEKLGASAQTGNARAFSATLRIPAKQLDGFLADVRKLGHVEREDRANEEVSDQYVDLQARLKSARATEQRLIELLKTRTGKLEDVLEAERELARIRSEIESMQGQSALLVHRVNYATVEVNLNEEYRQVLGSGAISTGTKLRNALVEGFKNLQDGAVSLLVFLFEAGPSILFWLAILLVPAWFGWKRFHRRAQS
jgi:Domain of unknown function (DUF4349)/Putative zinc-finger